MHAPDATSGVPSSTFDDMEDDIPEGDEQPADLAGPAPQTYIETCTRCRGSGQYLMGTCFACNGRGVREFKSSPEQRAKRAKPTPESRAAAAEKRESAEQRRAAKFALAHPDVHAWLVKASVRGFRIAQGMLGDVGRFGELRGKGMEAALRFMAQDAEREAKRDQEKAQAILRTEPVNRVNLRAVEEAFGRARTAGIKWPKLSLDGFCLKPAGESSSNFGAIYVTREPQGTYLGKVLVGSFTPSRDCNDQTKADVLAAMADPLASAVAYGKKYGRCAVCHRELTDPESIERGIGPVCATRMGW